MKLSIIGREDIETLEKWAVEYFSPIKNKDVKLEPWSCGFPYTDKELKKSNFNI